MLVPLILVSKLFSTFTTGITLSSLMGSNMLLKLFIIIKLDIANTTPELSQFFGVCGNMLIKLCFVFEFFFAQFTLMRGFVVQMGEKVLLEAVFAVKGLLADLTPKWFLTCKKIKIIYC